ncbi:transglycosylase family protein [Acinetobacter baumannii]|uniref:transglycosylase family protein n=1 Tax=Acinetobacter baumannii TaxID=470 RepID=UPI001CE1284F|nr:transglycosylase family protein [Acinetobacter baumannii]EHU1357215.1 transglycosylase family protein [Acinetobacter baumannii]UBX41664.1 transglycosylase family protein [Acinetobacter baumannii]
MELLADDELALMQDDPRYKPKNQRGNVLDVVLGAASGVAMGTVEVATAPDALIRGDKKAAALRAQNLTIFKPEDLGTAGELTFGLTKDFTRIGWDALATIGTGGYASLGLNAGLFGAQSYETEKADLINKGADIDTARTGGAIRGLTDAAGFVLPVHGIAKNAIADAVATTGLATAGGIAGDYVEGDYLKNNKNKKVAEYGEQLQENATSPLALSSNATMALMLNVFANKAKLRPEQGTEHDAADALNDAAQVQANIDHAEGLNPFEPTNAKDANDHFDALDFAQEQALNDELVSLGRPVSGTPKNIPVPAKVTHPLSFKGKSATIQQKIYDTALSSGLSDSEARAALAIAHFESGGSFDPNVTNPSSKYKGIYQFKPSTWRAEGGTDANYTDLDKQIELGIKHTKGNIAYIKKETGVTLTGSQIYLPHLLGRGGAKAVIRAIKNTPDARAEDVLRKVYGKDTDAVLKGNAINPDDSIQAAMGKFTSKIDNLIATQYGGDIKKGNLAIRGSDSDFPEFESSVAQIPEYKREGDVLIDASPNLFVNRLNSEPEKLLELEEDFHRLSEPLNSEDIEYLRETAHYQPYDGNVNRVAFEEPQINLSGDSRSAQRGLDELSSQLQRTDFQGSDVNTSPIKVLKNVDEEPRQPRLDEGQSEVDTASTSQIQAPIEGVENWQATRSADYIKREKAQSDGVTVQELYNNKTGTLFQRSINEDGNVSPIKISRSGKEFFAKSSTDGESNTPLSNLQSKAAQAIEREFWKPSKEKIIGMPKLEVEGKTEFGAFTETPDGREAVKAMIDNPDMEVTVNRLDDNGNEETISMTARDWLDYIREQEEIAKDEIQAVRALASCALKFGSEAA